VKKSIDKFIAEVKLQEKKLSLKENTKKKSNISLTLLTHQNK